ncbi:MAG: prepilin-type N-terminal cleavage/methylation domain-containing protein [Planctomycetes bacterium]|nr:prepilin-type N-terminal cleavage/methylation domain-containing protein [Planctomycetota bacterium]
MIARRRGFTLIELVIYMALCSVGLATFLMIEVGARQSLTLQGAILDLEEEGRRYLNAWRGDVEAAQQVLVSKDRVVVVRLDGHTVVYTQGSRVETDAKGKKLGVDWFPRTSKLEFELRGRELKATLEIRRSLGQTALTRTYRRVATPRLAAAVVKKGKAP